jgi:hypothetical protein
MAATKRAFHGVDDAIGREEEAQGGRPGEGSSRMIFGFPVVSGPTTRPAAVTQQFFPATEAVVASAPVRQHQQQVMEQCHEVAAVAAADPWTRSTLRKSRRGPRSRSSQYRGVTFYRRTGRWESHIWSVTKTSFHLR